MVAHARLAGGEDLRQLQHAERVVGQRAQDIQAQRVAGGLAQGGQFVDGLTAELGNGQVHSGRSLVGTLFPGKGCIKKF